MGVASRILARMAAGLVALSAITMGSTAAAQSETSIPSSGNGDGMDTHLYRPAVDSKGFFHVNGTDIIAAGDVSFGMTLDWAHTLMRTRNADAPAGSPGDPLDSDGLCTTVEECQPTSSGSGTDALLDDSFTGTISASYGIGNLVIVGLSLPISIAIGQDAYNLGPSGGTYQREQVAPQKFTTVIPHAKLRLLRVHDGFGLALVAQGGIPIAGAERDMLADPGAWYWPRLVAEKRFFADGRLKFGLDVGYRGHTGSNPEFGEDGFGETQLEEGTLRLGDRATYGIGISYRAIPRLDLVAEHYATYLLSDSDKRQKLSGEFLGGAKLFIEKNSYLMAAGGSRAFMTGFEAADARVVLGFVYEPSIGDRDGDGLRDDVDQCPDDPEDFDNFEDSDGCPDPDNDNDGIPDKKDRCPNIPEDMDGDEDDDGCPEGDKKKDRDGDGIPDDLDKCPDEPEDKDGFEDEDGCPDPDNDRDGILDVNDQCPDDAEDFDQFQDEDGCPEPDNDLDRIPDAQDQCPNEPEVYNGFEDSDGCPDKGKVIIDGSNIVILEKINFATASAEILPESMPIVEAVVAALKGHPEFTVIEVAGHADERGADDYNLDLTKRRASSVRAALNQRGIANDRIVSQGYGEYCPLERASNPAAWDKNRRVEFKVVKTEDGLTGVQRGCTEARDAGVFPPTVK
jgi:OmpA-OmpF porin, OOP family